MAESTSKGSGLPPHLARLVLRGRAQDKLDECVRSPVINPAKSRDLGEKAWACLSRNRRFQRVVLACRNHGLEAIEFEPRSRLWRFFGALGGSRRIGFRYPVSFTQDFASLPIRWRKALRDAVHAQFTPFGGLEVPREALMCGLVFEELREPGEQWEAEQLAPLINLGLRAVRLAGSGQRFFGAPRPLDPQHKQAIRDAFSNWLGEPIYKEKLESMEASVFLGTMEQWRDYLHFRYFVDRWNWDHRTALLATAYCFRFPKVGFGRLHRVGSDPNAIFSGVRADLGKSVKYCGERILSLKKAIADSFVKIFPKDC